MAMNPMQKKARTSFLLGMFLTLIITGLIIMFLIFQLAKIKQEEAAIQYKKVYVASFDITSGGYVVGNTKVVEVDSTVIPSNAITEENLATFITDASTTKIELKAGTILTTDMINTDGKDVSSDIRLQEYNMVILPTYLSAGDYIDIRLRLPSGEDYIVLSKKHVEDTNSDTIWLEVSEDEILTMSNAIVEAYIMEGSLLYATTYTDAGMQNTATPTYIVAQSVIDLINVNPNITDTARVALKARIDRGGGQRNTINQATSSYAEDAISNIEANLEEEIQKQQTARQEYVEALSTY